MRLGQMRQLLSSLKQLKPRPSSLPRRPIAPFLLFRRRSVSSSVFLITFNFLFLCFVYPCPVERVKPLFVVWFVSRVVVLNAAVLLLRRKNKTNIVILVDGCYKYC